MKYIMAQPAVKRFEWEIQVCVHSLIKAGVKREDIIILFSKHNDEVKNNILDLGVNVFVYEDSRYDYEYIPSLKPYLMYRYLSENRLRENETYFFMDSDVVIKDIPNQVDLETEYKTFYGSDCNGYLNYDYIKQCKNGKKILKDMAEIIGISVEEIKENNNNNIGAQYIMHNPSAIYFKKVYEDSIKLWKYIKDVDTDFQKWAVEMNATIWNMLYFSIIPKVNKDLNFTWATDPIEEWDKNKIFHNAGVPNDEEGIFFKGKYTQSSPFEDDLNNFDKDKASYKYVEKIKETKEWLGK